MSLMGHRTKQQWNPTHRPTTGPIASVHSNLVPSRNDTAIRLISSNVIDELLCFLSALILSFAAMYFGMFVCRAYTHNYRTVFNEIKTSKESFK